MYKALCFAAREMNHDRDGTMRLVWFALASIAVAFLACNGTLRSQPGNPEMHDDDDGDVLACSGTLRTQPGNPEMHDDDDGDDIDGASNNTTCGSLEEGERIVTCIRGQRSMDPSLDFGTPRVLDSKLKIMRRLSE